MSKAKSKEVTSPKGKPVPDIAVYMSEENTGPVGAQEDASIQEQSANQAALSGESEIEEANEPLDLPLVSEEFDPDQARTKKHPTEGALFKALIIFAGLGFAIFLFRAFFGGLNGPPSVAPVVRELDTKPKVKKADPSTDRTEIALVDSNRKRDAVAAQIAEDQKNKQKQNQNQNQKPEPRAIRQAPPPRQVTPVRVPPSRVPTPRRAYTPPPVVSSRPTPPPPRPAPSVAPPSPAPTVVTQPRPEVNRDMVAFGALPDGGNPRESEPSNDAINVDNRDEGLSNREQQQQAFVSGQTFVSNGTAIPGEVSEQAVAADKAIFTIKTQQAVPGIPEGSEVVAQVTQLSGEGHMTAMAIAINNADGSQSPIPPSAVKVIRPDGKLLKAKSGGGLFKGQLGRSLLGAAGGLADQVTSRAQSFTQNSLGTSTTLSAGGQDLTSLALSAVGGIADPLLEQPQESGQKALLINPGKAVLLKVSQSFSVL